MICLLLSVSHYRSPHQGYKVCQHDDLHSNDSLKLNFHACNRAELYLNEWQRQVSGYRTYSHHASKPTLVGYPMEKYLPVRKGRCRHRPPAQEELLRKYTGNRHYFTYNPVQRLQLLIQQLTRQGLSCSASYLNIYFTPTKPCVSL